MAEQKTHADVKAKVEANKWFYSDTVKDHFFNPKNILKTPEEVESFEKIMDGRGEVGSPACGDMMRMWLKIDKENDKITDCKWQTFGSLMPGSQVLMEHFKSKPVEEITMGDKIIDGEGKVNFVEETLIKDYKGKIMNIQLSTSKFYNFLVTPNHPMPCVRRKQVAIINRVSGSRWLEVSQEKIDSSEVTVIPAAELEKGDYLLFQVPTQTQDIKELDKDICTLLGYYVSDGGLPSKNRVIFYFGLNEKEYVDEIENIAKKRQWKYLIYKRNTENVFCVQINEPKVVEILRKHGGSPSKKIFSQGTLLLPAEKQEKIIDAYVNGDGWVLQQNKNWQPQYFISTSKEELAYQLQIMIGRLGVFAPIHKRPAREFLIKGKKYKNLGEINLIFRKNPSYSRIKYNKKEASFLIPISKVETDDYEGKIYDLGLVYEPKTYRVNGISLHNCASAIGSTSMLSVMLTEKGGMKIEDALKIKPQEIVERLHGLPNRKFHCSVLGDKALRAALNDYFRKSGQLSRIKEEGAKIVDKILKITDKDIEEAVLEGAHTLEEVQKKTKVGIQDKSCLTEVEELIRFYKEKYYG